MQKVPYLSNRNRTSDRWITWQLPLQSTALPTELSRADASNGYFYIHQCDYAQFLHNEYAGVLMILFLSFLNSLYDMVLLFGVGNAICTFVNMRWNQDHSYLMCAVAVSCELNALLRSNTMMSWYSLHILCFFCLFCTIFLWCSCFR